MVEHGVRRRALARLADVVAARRAAREALARVWRWGPLVTIGAVTAAALVARLPGWNPPALRPDDLIYGAIAKTDLWSMLAAPVHVAPGIFLALGLLYDAFPDPEWSLQLLPFACGLAAIPAMSAVVWSLTGDRSAAVAAAAVTALNPLLAHYSVTVRQYSLDFLVTALFLLGAAPLLRGAGAVDGRGFVRLAACGGGAVLVSVTSVFASGAAIGVGAVSAIWRWTRERESGAAGELSRIAAGVAGYAVAVACGYLLLRGRSNSSIREYWLNGFMPLDPAGIWNFLLLNGRGVLEKSLPLWNTIESGVPVVSAVDPDGRAMQTASWPLPLVAAGLIWLLWRRETRRAGLAVVGFYAACMVASALQIYPLGAGRPDIFAFPAAIALLAVGACAATRGLPGGRLLRTGLAAVAVAFALLRPVHVPYPWPRYDVPLVEYLEAFAGPDDGIMLSHAGGYLAALYGRWPVVVTPTDLVSYGAQAGIRRPNTLLLPYSTNQEASAAGFLLESPFRRVWYLAYRPRLGHDDVLRALEREGFGVHTVQQTGDGLLYMALR